VLLPNVAKLVEKLTPTAQPTGGGSLSRYAIPTTQVEYSDEKMVNELLKLEAPGQAIIVPDRPEAQYFVAVLVQKIPAYEENFVRDARQSDSLFGGYQQDSLLDWYEKETKEREEHRKRCLERLRADAGWRLDEENISKVPAPRLGDE
jgi:hypothetical protein